MKIHTEFIVLYPDQAMPSEESFCPSFWQAEDFDAEGNYYFEGIDGRWTDLEITRKEAGKPESTLTVYTHRQNGPIESGLLEVEDLGRYVTYAQEDRYGSDLQGIDNPAVTALAITTPSTDDYREFLETVHRFMAHTGASLVNYPEVLDASEFKEFFLDD